MGKAEKDSKGQDTSGKLSTGITNLLDRIPYNYLLFFQQKEKRNGRISVHLKLELPSQLRAYTELTELLVGNNVPLKEIKCYDSYYTESNAVYATIKEFKGGTKETGSFTLDSIVYNQKPEETLELTTAWKGCGRDIIYSVVDAIDRYVQIFEQRHKE